MVTYTVHEPPDPPADRIDRAERIEFIRDGFSWGAFLLTPVWLLLRRLWLPFVAFMAVAIAIAAAFDALDAGTQWAVYLALAAQMVVGYEAGTLRRWSLDRRGWRRLGSVSGRNREECERRFFTAWLERQPAISLPKAEGSAQPPARQAFRPWRLAFGRRA